MADVTLPLITVPLVHVNVIPPEGFTTLFGDGVEFTGVVGNAVAAVVKRPSADVKTFTASLASTVHT